MGLLVLLLNCLCFSCYLVMMQHRLRARPYPFTLFAAASVVGTTIITIEAMHDFGQVLTGTSPPPPPSPVRQQRHYKLTTPCPFTYTPGIRTPALGHLRTITHFMS